MDNSDKVDEVSNDATMTVKSEEAPVVEHKEPLLFCKWIVRKPVLFFVLFVFLHLGCGIVTGILFGIGYNILPIDFESMPVNLEDDPSYTRAQTWRHRLQTSYETGQSVRYVIDFHKLLPVWIRGFPSQFIELYYEDLSPVKNMLTRDNLEKMSMTENGLILVAEWQLYCRLEKSKTCAKPTSILRFFDGTYRHIDPVFYDPNFNNITRVLSAAMTYDATRNNVIRHLDSSSVITNNTAKSGFLRSFLTTGSPIDLGTGSQSQKIAIVQEWIKTHFRKRIEEFVDACLPSVGLYYYEEAMFNNDIKAQAYLDIAFTAGSFAFIAFVLVFHTRSFWISFFGMAGIFSSFVISNLIYRIVFNYQYFGLFHILSIFIIIGIGADDMFIFYDAWRSSGFSKYPSLEHRLSDAYSRAAGAMFSTSLTTMVAFFISAFSPVLMVKTFGLFSGLLVFVNYIAVITFFPTVIVVYHLHFEKKHICCCCRSQSQCLNCDITKSEQNCISKSKQNSKNCYKFSDNRVDDLHSQKQTVAVYHINFRATSVSKDVEKLELGHLKIQLPESAKTTQNSDELNVYINNCTDRSLEGETANIDSKRPYFVRFFGGPFFNLISHKIARWNILIIFTALIIGSIYLCTGIVGDNEQTKVFPAWHNYGKSAWLRVYGFRESDGDKKVRIYLVWGLKMLDTAICDFKNIEDVNKCIGYVVFDKKLNVNKASNQIALKNLCIKLRNLSKSTIDTLHIKVNSKTGNLEVECFMDRLEEFLLNEVKTRKFNAAPNVTIFPSSLDLSLPLDKAKMDAFMKLQPWIYRHANFSSDFSNWLEIGIDYWMSNAYTMKYTPDYITYSDMVGHWKTNQSVKIDGIYQWFGNEMKYFAIRINTTLNALKMSYSTGLPIMQHWENLMDQINSELPEGLDKGFMCTPGLNIYHGMKIQETFKDQAVYGVGIGIAVACPIIIIGTMNVITGITATLTILFTTVSVVGVIPLAGWKIGVLESVNLSLVVGLSVDYIVHLAQGYYYAPFEKRHQRAQNMLEEVGVSITAGAVTTLGASFFMLFCKIKFDYQFGLFLFCTVGFALLYALGLFSTLMAFFGPNKEVGSLLPLLRALRNKCRRTKKYKTNMTG